MVNFTLSQIEKVIEELNDFAYDVEDDRKKTCDLYDSLKNTLISEIGRVDSEIDLAISDREYANMIISENESTQSFCKSQISALESAAANERAKNGGKDLQNYEMQINILKAKILNIEKNNQTIKGYKHTIDASIALLKGYRSRLSTSRDGLISAKGFYDNQIKDYALPKLSACIDRAKNAKEKAIQIIRELADLTDAGVALDQVEVCDDGANLYQMASAISMAVREIDRNIDELINAKYRYTCDIEDNISRQASFEISIIKKNLEQIYRTLSENGTVCQNIYNKIQNYLAIAR